jgi:hypothetical protein
MEEKIKMRSLEDKNIMPGERTSVSLSKETKDRIANFGKGGESLETCLIRALDKAEAYDKEHGKS